MIRAWIFETADYPGNWREYDAARAALALEGYVAAAVRAEAQGYHGIFFSEHHFAFALSPSPNLLVAAVAVQTHRLRVGVLAQVLTMYPPWRVAEECGMLDLLSKGRLEIGVARGIAHIDTARVGIPEDEVRPRFEEALDVLQLALTRPAFNHHGRFWQFNDLSIVPRPLQQPHPPIWTSSMSVPSAQGAARRGFKISSAFHPAHEIKPFFDAYRETAAAQGRTAGADDFALRRRILVAEDGNAARAMARESDAMARRFFSGPAAYYGELIASGADTIAGTPAEVAEQILAQCELTGAGHILETLPYAPTEAMRRSRELFATQVIPRLSQLTLVPDLTYSAG